MADLTKQRDFSRVLAFHTQGRVIYWGGFENLEPPESEVLVNEFSRVSGYEPFNLLEAMLVIRIGLFRIGVDQASPLN